MQFIQLGLLVQMAFIWPNGRLSVVLVPTPPQINIDRACSGTDVLRPYCNGKDNDTSKYVNFTNNTVIFKEADNFFVGIECVASYPIEWKHFQEKWIQYTEGNWLTLLKSQSHRYTRTVDSLENNASYVYKAFLGLHNLNAEESYAVGKYTCQAINKDDSQTQNESWQKFTSSEISVFRTRKVYDHAFPLSGKNITVWSSQQDNRLIFPCYVAYQNVTVNLLRKKFSLFPFDFGNLHKKRKPSAATWTPVRILDGVEFKPDQGFVFVGMTPNDLPFGTYKCVLGTDIEEDVDPNDFVLITYVKGPEPSFVEHKSILAGKASFDYKLDNASHSIEISCCSNSTVPPNLFIAGCKSKSDCDKQKMILSQLDLKTQDANTNYLTAAPIGNCRRSLRISYRIYVPINVRCLGDGIDHLETFIFPFERDTSTVPFKPYLRWEDIDPQQMIEFDVVNWSEKADDGKTILVYDNQNVKFACRLSTAYFALSTAFTVDRTDGKQQLMKPVTMNHLELIKWGYPTFTIYADITKMDKSIASVSCFAAMVNSSQWIRKSLHVQIKDSKPVEIGNNETEEVYWSLSATSVHLSCSFSGIPNPHTIYWIKDGRKRIVPDQNNLTYGIQNDSNSTILIVFKVTHETKGEFQCVVENMFGKAQKQFQVFVEVSQTNWPLICSSVGMSCLGLILVVLGYRAWRQRKLITRRQ